MDIEELRLEALKLAVGAHSSVLPPEKLVEAAGRYAAFLEGKTFAADAPPYLVQVKDGETTVVPVRTLESEGQKWDEEARAKSERATLTSEEFFKALWAHHDSLKTSDGSCPSSEHHGC